jgi:hypothetical protein
MSLKNSRSVLFLLVILAMLTLAVAAALPRPHPSRLRQPASQLRPPSLLHLPAPRKLASCCRPRMSRAGSRTRPVSRSCWLLLASRLRSSSARASSATEKSNVESLLTKGVKVIILTPQDGAAAAPPPQLKTRPRTPAPKVVSYDRLILGTDAVDYYVTFDSNAVGAAQASIWSTRPPAAGNPLYLYAGASSDNNAFLFFEGAWDVLQPKIADGTFRDQELQRGRCSADKRP